MFLAFLARFLEPFLISTLSILVADALYWLMRNLMHAMKFPLIALEDVKPTCSFVE
jgi:hypothetical protein